MNVGIICYASIGGSGVIATELGKTLGLLQAIEVGSLEFDKAFVVSGTSKKRVRTLFADPEFRQLILAQPDFNMAVKDTPWALTIGSAPDFPADVDVLHCHVTEAILDVDGTLVGTDGECKQGVDIAYNGT